MEQERHATLPWFQSFIQTRYPPIIYGPYNFIVNHLDERSSVLISKDFTISDFTIPSDFELIIDDGVTIGVDLKISNCQGEDY